MNTQNLPPLNAAELEELMRWAKGHTITVDIGTDLLDRLLADYRRSQDANHLDERNRAILLAMKEAASRCEQDIESIRQHAVEAEIRRRSQLGYELNDLIRQLTPLA